MQKRSEANDADTTRARQLVEIQNAFAQIASGLEADLKKLPHVPRHGPSTERYERGQVVADAKYRAGGLLLRAFQLGAFADAQKAPSLIAVLDPPGSGLISITSSMPALFDAMRGFLVETGHQFLPITTLPEDGWDCVLSIRTLANVIGDTVKGVFAEAGGQGGKSADNGTAVTDSTPAPKTEATDAVAGGESGEKTKSGSQAAPKRSQWVQVGNPPDGWHSKRICGLLKQLAKWEGTSQKTLKAHNPKGVRWWIIECGGTDDETGWPTPYAIYYPSEAKFLDANKRRREEIDATKREGNGTKRKKTEAVPRKPLGK